MKYQVSLWMKTWYLHTHENNMFYYINTNEIPGELSRENMISSHVKITCYFHMWKYHCCYGALHNKSRLSQEKNCFNEMVWYFIGVYIINRTLHGRLRIRNFSSRVENISLVRGAYLWNIFQHLKRNIVSPRGHVISSISSHLKSWKDHCSNGCIISHPFCRKNIINVKWFGMSLIGV